MQWPSSCPDKDPFMDYEPYSEDYSDQSCTIPEVLAPLSLWRKLIR